MMGNFILAFKRTLVGTGSTEVNGRELSELVRYDLLERRGVEIRAQQHWTAVVVPCPVCELLKTLDTPALLIHGTIDRRFPIDHGRSLAEIVPNDEFLWPKGVGPVFHYPNRDGLTA